MAEPVTIEAPEIGDRTLLVIDTSLGSGVAVAHRGAITECSSDDPLRHAEAIGPMIANALASAGARAEDVDGVVFGVGPGPFTGLRVGIAAARAFALGAGVPLFPMHGHEAVALAELEQGAASGVRIVQDARRRELFVTGYSGLDWAGIPERTEGPRVVARDEFRAGVGDVWPERIPCGRLAQLAARRLRSGRDFEADEALYLRAPDVRPPAPRKRIVP